MGTDISACRWLGADVFILGLGALLFATLYNSMLENMMLEKPNLSFEASRDAYDFAPDCKGSSSVYVVFILVGNILIGVGSTPLFIIGTSYVDDIIHPKCTPICLGVFYTVA